MLKVFIKNAEIYLCVRPCRKGKSNPYFLRPLRLDSQCYISTWIFLSEPCVFPFLALSPRHPKVENHLVHDRTIANIPNYKYNTNSKYKLIFRRFEINDRNESDIQKTPSPFPNHSEKGTEPFYTIIFVKPCSA